MSQPTKHFYEFGSFRLDAVERLFLRNGEMVALTPKAIDLLLVLVERHGHLVEKDELLKLVWPDTFVEEANLSYNISLIRKALGDGENGYKFIETVPKRGYRFVAEVCESGAEQAESNEAVVRHSEAGVRPAPLTSKINRHRKGALLALAALVIAIGGIGFGLYKFINQPQSQSSGAEPKVIPFTSFPGEELQPTFSPDGNQIAFVSRNEKDGNADIYVKLIDSETPLRLTTDPAADAHPAWSPDGRWIYFGSNRSGSLQIWKMPAEGGQLTQVTSQGGFEGLESPDGKFFYYAKGRRLPGIWRIPVEGGTETPVLDHHQAGFWRVWTVTEQGIYFATAENPSRPLIEFFSFATGQVTQIAALEKPFYLGLSVSPDGRWLIYSQLDQSGSDIMLMENFR